MISRENYSNEHIQELQAGRRTDIKLIERNLFAFGLLEALATVGLDFTFKGGTSLMLLLKKPMRLSTDIDIIVKPGTDVDSYLKKAYEIFPFYILLDILFAYVTQIVNINIAMRTG